LFVGYVVASMVTSIWLFGLMQGLVGFGAAATFGPLIADLSHWFNKRRGVAVAAAASGNYFGGAIWPILVQSLMRGWGCRYSYAVILIVCFVGFVSLALMLRRRAPYVSAPAGTSAAVPSNSIDLSPRALQLLLAVAGVGCCMAMAMPQ